MHPAHTPEVGLHFGHEVWIIDPASPAMQLLHHTLARPVAIEPDTAAKPPCFQPVMDRTTVIAGKVPARLPAMFVEGESL